MSNKFKDFYEIDISKHTEKKGKFTYLSWAYAWKFMKEQYEDASFLVHEYNDAPYMKTELGYFVKVSVTANGITHSQTHPVLDFQNNAMTSPTAFDINKSIQRCLAKAIALHGLGLGLWINEDICDTQQQSEQQQTGKKQVTNGQQTDNTQQQKKVNKEEMSPEDINKLKEQIHKLCENMSPDEKRQAIKKASYYQAKTTGKESYIDDINDLKRGNYDAPSWQLKLTIQKLQESMLSQADFVSDEL
jgi:hypothetical protein